MIETSFESCDIVGSISCSEQKTDLILKDQFTFHYIPDCVISTKNPSVMVYERPIKERVNFSFPYFILNPEANARSFVVGLEYLMERERQEKKGVYALSSSSVYRGNKALIFFGGETNLGKSSCALELVKNGFHMFSDEKSLVDLSNATLVGGSRGISLKKEIIRKKLGVEGDYQKISLGEDRNLLVKMMILPHLDHGLTNPITDQFSPKDFFWLLTKELSRRIRGSTKFINEGEYLLPSIDTEELAQQRIARTKEFCNKVPCFYFQGSLSQLNELLAKEF